ncbi:MAG: alkyl hydroperoxide reductase [Frankiales bacterium]|nr:alkyl hydroperoxide reductase [Frankiales bacterium]
MSLDALKQALPAYAKDLKLNLGSVVGNSTVPEQRLWGAVLAAAIASRNPQVLRELDEEARTHLSDVAYDAARAAAAIMAMNNIYYRGKHLLRDSGITGYDDTGAKLRMQVIGTSGGVDKSDFEFWSFAVSAVNGCGQCLASHEEQLRAAGLSREDIHEALRIAGVVHAVAVTLEAEGVLANA